MHIGLQFGPNQMASTVTTISDYNKPHLREKKHLDKVLIKTDPSRKNGPIFLST